MHEYDNYEPTDDEIREMEELINQEEEQIEFEEEAKNRFKNRLTFQFATEDHWAGWLRIHGMKW